MEGVVVEKRRRRDDIELGDMKATPERQQHDEIETGERLLYAGEEGRSRSQRTYGQRVTTQRPVDRYLKRGWITARQWQAAERIAALWHQAGLEPRVTASWSPSTQATALGNVGMAASERQAHARMELRRVLARCGGQIGAAVVVAVVCDREAASSWAARMDWPREQGIGALKLALEAAADDLGLDRSRS
jgi:hypothetical protein